VSAAEFLKKAENALASARRDFDAGGSDGAANRLYYAMFHAARAALESIGVPPRGQARDDHRAVRPAFLQKRPAAG
jgi:uncharacterized protein (UPF0332 family)